MPASNQILYKTFIVKRNLQTVFDEFDHGFCSDQPLKIFSDIQCEELSNSFKSDSD